MADAGEAPLIMPTPSNYGLRNAAFASLSVDLAYPGNRDADRGLLSPRCRRDRDRVGALAMEERAGKPLTRGSEPEIRLAVISDNLIHSG